MTTAKTALTAKTQLPQQLLQTANTPLGYCSAVAVTDAEEFTITLKPLPGWRTTPIQRLRAALKLLLRSYGMRAVTVTETNNKKEKNEN
jgi:hypothetical protein